RIGDLLDGGPGVAIEGFADVGESQRIALIGGRVDAACCRLPVQRGRHFPCAGVRQIERIGARARIGEGRAPVLDGDRAPGIDRDCEGDETEGGRVAASVGGDADRGAIRGYARIDAGDSIGAGLLDGDGRLAGAGCGAAISGAVAARGDDRACLRGDGQRSREVGELDGVIAAQRG
ncbi:HTH tetR-type domain-containing protein, partial [Dysosmobacter welbionis]